MKLAWEIEVLSRAVAYPNLSVAASQIGISQPQISRILKKVENELGIVLLDRDSKRRVSWKPEAHALVAKFLKISRQWDTEVQSFSSEPGQIKRIRIGCLEGVSEAVVEFLQRLISDEHSLEEVELEVLDIGDLEKEFIEGNFDLIFTSRSPGKKKFTHTLGMGFQKFESVNAAAAWIVQTPFEFSQKRRGSQREKRIITKSLWIKRLCAEKLGASARIPSRLKKFPKAQKFLADRSASEVFLIGSEDMSKHFWSDVQKCLD